MILDATAVPFTLAVREGVFMIKPNLREISALAEEDITDETQQEKIARQIIDSGQSKVMVVSLGAAGALLVWQIGAGDSTVAGIVLSLSQGRSLLDSVKFGLASGAAAVMTPGTELCRGEDARRLFRSMANQ